jgi:CheY-like chemotaxis protein
VETALRDNVPAVQGDETQLQEVAMNLILNAAEATTERGGKIIVRTNLQEIDSTAAAKPYDVGRLSPGQYAVLEVQDNGTGIDPAIKPSLFDPFFTTKFTGRGLGLAALSGIVRVLNGAVLVNSTPGHGSIFQVLLPVATPGMEINPGSEEKNIYSVLVVDDEEIVCKTAELMLRNQGYQVIVAENGYQAVEQFGKLEGRLMLVLLDMTMPGMSGEETFRRFKAVRADVPVIVCSGFGEAEAIRRFGGLGVAGFIQKPYTLQTLTEKIQAVLRHRGELSG